MSAFTNNANQMITYGQLYSFVRPFFLARGGDAFASNENLRMYANMAIQDLYNGDDSTWAYENETLILTPQDTYYETEASHSIKKLEDCYDDKGKRYVPELATFVSEDQCRFREKKILIPRKILSTYGMSEWQEVNQGLTKIYVSYVRDYRFVDEETEKTALVPVPDSYVPALIKLIYDWAAPVSILVGETDNPDFFSHASARLTQLKNNDALTNSPNIRLNRN